MFLKKGVIFVTNKKIIDFFTHKSYEEIATQDYKSNEEITEKYGDYLGNLMNHDSEKLRTLRSQIEFKTQQINQRMGTAKLRASRIAKLLS